MMKVDERSVERYVGGCYTTQVDSANRNTNSQVSWCGAPPRPHCLESPLIWLAFGPAAEVYVVCSLAINASGWTRHTTPSASASELSSKKKKKARVYFFSLEINPKTRTRGGGFTRFCFVSEGFFF